MTMAGYVFPLITFPYITRVLGVEGIGSIQFAESVISYFTIFATLGIGTVGVREIAKAKGKRDDLNRAFSGLLFLNLLLTILAIIVLFILISIIPSFESHSKLLYIGISRILCGTLMIEWFFKGIEDFKYITVRTLLIRTLYVFSVFIFVRDADDTLLYFLLTSLTIVISAIINIIYSKRSVTFTLKKLDLKPYIKPLVIMGLYLVLTSMYNSFNVIFLGNYHGDVEVGYYSTTVKLYNLIMSVFTAFTGVMLPRMSTLISEGKDDEFRIMTSKSIDVLLLFCLPIMVLTEVYAPQIIRIIAGTGYEGAIVPMRIVMPLMLVIGYEQIIILQMLMPLGKDNAILTNSAVGAVVALILNLTIVPMLASIGTAIVWCACEIVVAGMAQYFVTKYSGYKLPFKKIATSILAYVPALLVCCLLNRFNNNQFVSFAVGIVFTGIYFLMIELFVLKNSLLINNFSILKERFIRH